MADIIKWFLVEKEISCIIYNLTAILNFLWEAGKYFYAVFCVYERNTKCCFFMEQEIARTVAVHKV